MRALARHVVQFDRWAEALGMGLDSAMMGISLFLVNDVMITRMYFIMIFAYGL